MRTVSSNHAAYGCYSGISLPLLRHMATMDTLAALYLSTCETGAGAASHVEAPARLVAQHQNAAKRRTVLALLRHSTLPHSVASDAKLLETSRGLGTGGLGTGVAPSRASSARGEKMTVHVLNADSNKTFYMSVEPTHVVYQPT